MSGWRLWSGQSSHHVAGVCCHGNLIVHVNVVGFCEEIKHNTECLQEVNKVQMYTLLPFFLFLKEVTQKNRKIIDMTVVMTDKVPKPVANPIIGPEGHRQTVVNQECMYTQYIYSTQAWVTGYNTHLLV